MKITIFDEETKGNDNIVVDTDAFEFSVKGLDGVLTISITVPKLLKMELSEKETRILGNAASSAAKITKNQPKSGCCDDENEEVDPFSDLVEPDGG